MKSLKKISLFLFFSILLSNCGASAAFWPFNKKDKKKLTFADKVILGVYFSAYSPIGLRKILKALAKSKKQKKDVLLGAIDRVKPSKAIKKKVNHQHKKHLRNLIKEYNRLDNNFWQNHPRFTSLYILGSSGVALASTIIAIVAHKGFYTAFYENQKD